MKEPPPGDHAVGPLHHRPGRGQGAVAVALRNRYRRSQLDEELRNEINPKNIRRSGPPAARPRLPAAWPSW